MEIKLLSARQESLSNSKPLNCRCTDCCLLQFLVVPLEFQSTPVHGKKLSMKMNVLVVTTAKHRVFLLIQLQCYNVGRLVLVLVVIRFFWTNLSCFAVGGGADNCQMGFSREPVPQPYCTNLLYMNMRHCFLIFCQGWEVQVLQHCSDTAGTSRFVVLLDVPPPERVA